MLRTIRRHWGMSMTLLIGILFIINAKGNSKIQKITEIKISQWRTALKAMVISFKQQRDTISSPNQDTYPLAYCKYLIFNGM